MKVLETLEIVKITKVLEILDLIEKDVNCSYKIKTAILSGFFNEY